jgi:hypothetical protein
MIYFISIIKPFLTYWSSEWFVPFIYFENRAHGRCKLSTEDAYSSMAYYSTSDISRRPYTFILWFVLPMWHMRLIIVRYFHHIIKKIYIYLAKATAIPTDKLDIRLVNVFLDIIIIWYWLKWHGMLLVLLCYCRYKSEGDVWAWCWSFILTERKKRLQLDS